MTRAALRRAALIALPLLALHVGPSAWAQGEQEGTETTTAAAGPADLEAQRLQREATRLEQIEKDRSEALQPSGEFSLVGKLVETFVMLGAICALAYLFVGKLLPRFFRIQPPTAQQRVLTVVDRMPLDQRRSIMVVRVADEVFLIGASDGGIQLISKLDPESIPDEVAPAPNSISKFARHLLNRTEKGS